MNLYLDSNSVVESLEQEALKLKYFYRINPYAIADSFSNSEAAKTTDHFSNDIVSALFEHCFNSLGHYTSFLSVLAADDTNSMFGECSLYNDFAYRRYILQIALYHHCLITGYLRLMHRKNLSDTARSKTLSSPTLSSAYDIVLRSGYYQKNNISTPRTILKNFAIKQHHSLEEYDGYPSSDENKTCAQRWNQYYKSHKASLEKNSGKLYIELLGKYIRFSEDYRSTPVSGLHANWIYFLFTESRAKSFVRPSSANFNYDAYIKKYNVLFSLICDRVHQMSNNMNKLIFRTNAESCYGFFTMSYLTRLQEELYPYTDNASNPLQPLTGQSLQNITHQMLSMPNIFSRHLFLDYALYCYKKIDNKQKTFSENYLQPDPSTFGILLNKKRLFENSTVIADDNLNLISHYIQLLSHITIPLLEDLWDVIFTHYFEQAKHSDNCPDLEAIYVRLLSENYNLITFDFAQIQSSNLNTIFGCSYPELQTKNPPCKTVKGENESKYNTVSSSGICQSFISNFLSEHVCSSISTDAIKCANVPSQNAQHKIRDNFLYLWNSSGVPSKSSISFPDMVAEDAVKKPEHRINQLRLMWDELLYF